MTNTNLRKPIDYYCFPTKTGDISVYTDVEQYTNWREKDHYQIAQEDVLRAKELGKLLLFDLRNNSFIDSNGNSVDIKGKVIFPRSTIGEADLLTRSIEQAEGKSITGSKDYEIVENWFELVKPKRQLKLTTRREVEENIEAYEQKYGKKIFIKTVQKRFSGVCIIVELNISGKERKVLMDPHRHSLNMSITDAQAPILVCKAVDVLKDEFGSREWRAFVVQDELLCLSRCSDDIVQVEEYVYDEARKNIEKFKGIIPSSYVVDFFEYKEDNGEIIFDICEFNPIIASGVYQNNDLVF